MTVTTTDRSAPLSRVAVSFPLSNLNLNAYAAKMTAEIAQKFNTHDVIFVKVPDVAVANVSSVLAYGAPALVEWTTSDGKASIPGYVHDASQYVDSNLRGTTITVMSAGFVLKTKRSRLFTNTSASAIAEQIARENGLNADVEPHARVFPQVAQAGCSDWEVLVDLARRIGYSVRVEGITLQFISRGRLSRFYRAMAPQVTVTTEDQIKAGGLRDILSFTPMTSEHQQILGETNSRHTVTGIDLQGNPITASAHESSDVTRSITLPAFSTYYTGDTPRSQVEAQQIADGWAEANRYPVQAHAVMWGNPFLTPNRVINITGTGSAHDGFWTVLEARHYVKTGSAYQMEVILGTESLGAETQGASTQTSVPPTGLLKVPYPDARLVQGELGVALAQGAVQYVGGPRWAPAN